MRLIVGLMVALAGSSCVAHRSPDSATEGAEAVGAIVLEWTTASEYESYGYHVYRSLSEEGPFERINEEIIAGAGTTDVMQRYGYTDDNAEIGVTYTYYVESVSLDGKRIRLTPLRTFTRSAAREVEPRKDRNKKIR